MRRESKIAAKIDKADRKKSAAKAKQTRPKKSRGKPSSGLREIGDDFSSQNEEAEDEVERVSRGPG